MLKLQAPDGFIDSVEIAVNRPSGGMRAADSVDRLLKYQLGKREEKKYSRLKFPLFC